MSRVNPGASRLPGPVLRSRVLAYIAAKRWRGELGIVRHFRPSLSSAVEDALFELVTAGKLEWFGAEDPNGHLPLRYRVARRASSKRSAAARLLRKSGAQ